MNQNASARQENPGVAQRPGAITGTASTTPVAPSACRPCLPWPRAGCEHEAPTLGSGPA